MMNKEKIIDLINDAEEVLARTKKMFLEKKSIHGSLELAKTLINEAELLLLNEPEASAETAPCANAVLGDSAANVGSSILTPPAGGLGETPAVRQNEQTKEVCTCGNVEAITKDNVMYCISCGGVLW